MSSFTSDREKEHRLYRIMSLLLRTVTNITREVKALGIHCTLNIWEITSNHPTEDYHFELVILNTGDPKERAIFYSTRCQSGLLYSKENELEWIRKCIETIIDTVNENPSGMLFHGSNVRLYQIMASSAVFKRMVDSHYLIKHCDFAIQDYERSQSYKYLLTFLILVSHISPSLTTNSSFLELIEP